MSTRGSMPSEAASAVSTPAARSFSSAPEAASARLARCQTRAASPSTAASSGAQLDLRQLVRLALDAVARLLVPSLPVSSGMPSSRSSSLSRSNMRLNASVPSG